MPWKYHTRVILEEPHEGPTGKRYVVQARRAWPVKLWWVRLSRMPAATGFERDVFATFEVAVAAAEAAWASLNGMYWRSVVWMGSVRPDCVPDVPEGTRRADVESAVSHACRRLGQEGPITLADILRRAHTDAPRDVIGGVFLDLIRRGPLTPLEPDQYQWAGKE